jgi:hypothetical protein
MTTTTTSTPHPAVVALPPRAVHAEEWQPNGDGRFYRFCYGETRDFTSPNPPGQLVQAVWERLEAIHEWSRLVREAPADVPDADPDARMRANLFKREIHYAQQRIQQLNARIHDLGGTVTGETDE